MQRTIVGLWGVLTTGSLVFLARYSTTAGPDAMPRPLQDAQLPLAADGAHHLLVMAIHPKCPCSRASLGELTRLLSWHPSRLKCVVLVYRPGNSDANWQQTNLVESVRQLPGTTLIDDTEGRYAKRLNAFTSGAVVLYSPTGVVEFHGGITPARGHWGDNVGSDAIHAILDGKTPMRRATPVFGCPIHSPQERTRAVKLRLVESSQ